MKAVPSALFMLVTGGSGYIGFRVMEAGYASPEFVSKWFTVFAGVVAFSNFFFGRLRVKLEKLDELKGLEQRAHQIMRRRLRNRILVNDRRMISIMVGVFVSAIAAVLLNITPLHVAASYIGAVGFGVLGLNLYVTILITVESVIIDAFNRDLRDGLEKKIEKTESLRRFREPPRLVRS